jgi:spoIIIJ-associated protein
MNQKIQTIINNFLAQLGIKSFEIKEEIVETLGSDETNSFKFLVKTEESSLLIGVSGDTLRALNQIIKRMVEKEFGEGVKVLVDVNNYYANSLKKLKEKVTMLSDRVRAFQTSIELEPMSSYERMVVHSMFADSKDIETGSTGFGATRHIVLKYKKPETSQF